MRASQVAKIQWNRWRTFSLHSDRMWIVLCFPGPVQKLQCTVTPWRNQVIWQGMYNLFHRKTGSHIWEVHLYIQMKSVFFIFTSKEVFIEWTIHLKGQNKKNKCLVWGRLVLICSSPTDPLSSARDHKRARSGGQSVENRWTTRLSPPR